MSERGGHRPAWSEAVKARALVLLAEHRNATAAANALAAELAPEPGPKRTTLITWAAQAGIELTAVNPVKRAATVEAARTRSELDAEARAVLSRAIRDRLSMPAVELLARRLDEAQEEEAIYRQARTGYLDRLAMEAHAADLGEEELKAAKAATAFARRELIGTGELRMSTLDLVRIATYGVRDHLKLEGSDIDTATGLASGNITVVFDLPPEHEETPA